MEVNGKEDIIKKIKEYGLFIDDTHTENNETFLLICDVVSVDNISFRDVREIHFIGDTMWIDNASVDANTVTTFRISFMSINYDVEELQKHFEQVLKK